MIAMNVPRKGTKSEGVSLCPVPASGTTTGSSRVYDNMFRLSHAMVETLVSHDQHEQPHHRPGRYFAVMCIYSAVAQRISIDPWSSGSKIADHGSKISHITCSLEID